jgi:hypothetical protein
MFWTLEIPFKIGFTVQRDIMEEEECKVGSHG